MWADFKFKWKCYYKVCWTRGQKAEHLALLMFWSLYAIFLKKKVQISVWLETCSLLQQTVVQECLSWVYFLSLVSDQVVLSWTAKHEAVKCCQTTWRVPEQVFSRGKVWHKWLNAAQGSALTLVKPCHASCFQKQGMKLDDFYAPV